MTDFKTNTLSRRYIDDRTVKEISVSTKFAFVYT